MWDLREAAEVVGARLLRPQPPFEASGASCDSRRIRPGDLFVAIVGARHDGHDFVEEAFSRGAVGALVSRDPGTGHNLIVVEDVQRALWELGHWRRRELAIPTVGVAGSFGKTTTKELLAAALGTRFRVYRTPESYNTEIGVPLALLSVPDGTEVAVFELGMCRRGEIKALCELVDPWAGIITGIGEEHLASVGSMQDVVEAEWELAACLPEEGILALAWDYPELRRRVELCQALCLRFGASPEADFFPSQVRAHDPQGVRFTLQSPAGSYKVKLQLLGEHVAVLACGALALSWAMGVPLEAAIPALAEVRPLPHRLQLIPTWFGWILDDCYNANPRAVRAALDVLMSLELPARRRAFLFGDMLDLGPEEGRFHREVVEYAAEVGVDMLFAVGTRAVRAYSAWEGEGAVAEDLEGILPRLREAMRGAPTLLLVKASRGMALERAVEALLE
ncbi:UDP-N-acetylmuramoyl-tripeptide--D-alanyl-D-alanine ligase [Candidatus Bipolaricaulota sp. J31]